MRSAGPLWALAFTLDRDLLVAVLCTNLAFTLVVLRVLFRGRRVVDRLLIGVAVFLLVSGTGLAALHGFARTPVREISFFAVD